MTRGWDVRDQTVWGQVDGVRVPPPVTVEGWPGTGHMSEHHFAVVKMMESTSVRCFEDLR